MKILVTMTAALILTGIQAKADGFVCTTESGIIAKVFNHTHPEMGTRTGAVMIISDSNISAGNKTIATFKHSTGLLKSKELLYTGKVDLRFSDISRKGELIGGTKLGELAEIKLNVNFNYLYPVADGDLVSGRLHLHKRNGVVLSEFASCARYLKN